MNDAEADVVGFDGSLLIPGAGGASVSNVNACPTTGKDALNTFPARSAIEPLLVRFNPIEPLSDPVVPVVLAVTVYTAPLPDSPEIDGAVPKTLLVTNPKSPATTPVTGSLNVTVHEGGPVFVGFFAPAARLIELTVGGVVSTVHEYDPATVVVDP